MFRASSSSCRSPEIVVRQAIKQAGFNPDTPWIIVLKVAGEPKREVDLSFVIDLRHKGIEKLRLTPRQINNGEMAAGRRVEFALLPQDEEHLDHLGLRWETLVDGGRRWLIIRNYPLPPGYRSPVADIAIEVPVSYPGAQLDMFYCHPPLALPLGRGDSANPASGNDHGFAVSALVAPQAMGRRARHARDPSRARR